MRGRGDKGLTYEGHGTTGEGDKSNVHTTAGQAPITGGSSRDESILGMDLEMAVMVDSKPKSRQGEDVSTKSEESGTLPSGSTMSSTLAVSSDNIGGTATMDSGEQERERRENPQVVRNILDRESLG